MDNNIAFETLTKSYLKLLFIDADTRKVTPIILPADEVTVDDIDYYWSWFLGSGLIHNDDIERFDKFTTPPLDEGWITYRRKVGDNYIRVLMEIKKSSDYSEKNKVYLCFVRDINEIYVAERNIVIDTVSRLDQMTGTFNRKAFETDMSGPLTGNIGILYCDINGLKWTNDSRGHETGDALIKSVAKTLKDEFPAYSVYRVGGDEFVTVAYNTKTREFIRNVILFHKKIWQQIDFPKMSVGYSIDDASDIHNIILDAEAQMYEDKQMFYKSYPQYKR